MGCGGRRRGEVGARHRQSLRAQRSVGRASCLRLSPLRALVRPLTATRDCDRSGGCKHGKGRSVTSCDEADIEGVSCLLSRSFLRLDRFLPCLRSQDLCLCFLTAVRSRPLHAAPSPSSPFLVAVRSRASFAVAAFSRTLHALAARSRRTQRCLSSSMETTRPRSRVRNESAPREQRRSDKRSGEGRATHCGSSVHLLSLSQLSVVRSVRTRPKPERMDETKSKRSR